MTTPVTLEYLKSLPIPTFGVGFDRQEILDSFIASVEGANPDWRYADRGRLARVLSPLAETVWTYGEINENQNLRGLLVFAVGNDLDVIAGDAGLIRSVDELDDALKGRVARRPILNSVGTLDRIEYNAFQTAVLVVDAQAATRTNRQDVDLWALKASLEDLTTAEQSVVSLYANRTDQVIMGVEVHVDDVTKTDYDITTAVTYDEGLIDSATLIARVESQLEDFMEAQAKLGLPIYHSAIIARGFTPGVVNMVVSAPGSALTATPGTVYVGGTVTVTATAA